MLDILLAAYGPEFYFIMLWLDLKKSVNAGLNIVDANSILTIFWTKGAAPGPNFSIFICNNNLFFLKIFSTIKSCATQSCFFALLK
jgi:hypothetical protein